MDDYRDKLCIVNGKHLMRCVGQDWFSEKLYFQLPAHLAYLDCDRCTVPTIELSPGYAEIIDSDRLSELALEALDKCLENPAYAQQQLQELLSEIGGSRDD